LKSLIAALFLFVIPACSMAQAPTPVSTVLPNGVRLICQQESSSSLVAITIFVQTGSAQETPRDAGIGSMVADSILTGTTNQDSDTIQTSIGNVGGNVKAIWQPDFTQIRALVLPTQFGDTAYLLSDVLKNADFPDASVETARQDLYARIQERMDDVFESTNDRLRAYLYSGTPYSLPQLGTVDSVKRLTRTDLLDYFQDYYIPSNILISVVGNVDPSAVAQTFGDDLSDFNRQRVRHDFPLLIPAVSDNTRPVVVKAYRSDVSAGLMMVGYLAPGAGSDDYPAMVLVNALLGGMKTSVMFKNLRIKYHYSYELGSDYNVQLGLSDETGYILYSTTPTGNNPPSNADQTAVVKDALLAQFQILANTPPTETDLERAKKFVIGSYLISHERIEDRSYYLGYSALGFPHLGGASFDSSYADLINNVTAADVTRVAKKYFSAAPVISLLLPGSPTSGVQVL